MADYIRLEYTQSKKLEEKMRLLPEKAEYEVNHFLWSDGVEKLEAEVYKQMPRSQYKKYGIPKKHAKDTNSLKITRFNLGIKVETRVKPKTSNFGYLIFPNEGRGIKQQNKGAQEFFEKALENTQDEITEGLINHLDKKIIEEGL